MSNKVFKPEQVTANIAMTVAQNYQLEAEVSKSMSDGYSPYASLVEWDIVDEEFIQILIEKREKEIKKESLETIDIIMIISCAIMGFLGLVLCGMSL